jgi:hypothetical protein
VEKALAEMLIEWLVGIQTETVSTKVVVTKERGETLGKRPAEAV